MLGIQVLVPGWQSNENYRHDEFVAKSSVKLIGAILYRRNQKERKKRRDRKKE